MKRILGIAMVLGLLGALTAIAQEVKPGEVEVIDLGKGVKLEMVLIPAGKFMMGSTKEEVEKAIETDSFFKSRSEKEINKIVNVRKVVSSEMPKHEVMITKPTYMSKYEVTQEQWESVMENNPSTVKGAKLPVTDVSWNECQYFINNLNKMTKGNYKLPSEAEWEYACRAGTATAYSCGDQITQKDSNFGGDKSASVKPVGGYKPNAFGLYDMHGNVWEWCEDWYGHYPPGAVIDPIGPEAGVSRVLRGGSFDHFSELALRSSNRYHSTELTTSFKNPNIGFRLAKSIGSKLEIKKPEHFTFKKLLEVPFTEANAKIIQKETAARLNKSVEVKEIYLELVLIPAGKFLRGSNKIPLDPFSNIKIEQPNENEVPQHEVTLTKPYYMGKYEVTQEQWFEIMGENPSRNKGRKLPVTDVSWEDCQDFIKNLNAKTEGGYRLPTEAEWEYACRAGTTTAYSFGDILTLTNSDANTGLSRGTKAVGSYRPNAFGLYDMHGNVEECCEDWYGAYPAGAVIDPKGPATGTRRVYRGGSLGGLPSVASSYREFNIPTLRGSLHGFRLARTR
jgi:formylglycine-generating enzyme required for sulfatase activity